MGFLHCKLRILLSEFHNAAAETLCKGHIGSAWRTKLKKISFFDQLLKGLLNIACSALSFTSKPFWPTNHIIDHIIVLAVTKPNYWGMNSHQLIFFLSGFPNPHVFVSLSDFLSVFLVGFLYPCRTPCSQCFTADYSHQGTHFHSHNAIHPHDLRITKFHFGFVTLGKSILDMCHPWYSLNWQMQVKFSPKMP